MKKYLIILLFSPLFISCNKIEKPVPSNFNQIIKEITQSGDYNLFRGSIMMPRNNYFMYWDESFNNFYANIEYEDGNIIIPDEINNYDSLKEKYGSEYPNIKKTIIEKLQIIHSKMLKYSIKSYWGIKHDSSGVRLSITFFESYNLLYINKDFEKTKNYLAKYYDSVRVVNDNFLLVFGKVRVK